MKQFLLSLCLLGFTQLSEAAEKPNILLIFADDIGYEALNCYGGLDFETPHLDRMASEGARFSRAYTSPVCTPSRVSLHTGLYVPRHGHTGVLPVHQGTNRKVDFGKLPTFSQLIRKNGYLTSTTGKWQLATLEVWPDHIREAGFDSWCVWQIWREGEKTLRHWNPTFNEDGRVRDDIDQRFGPDVLVEYVKGQMVEAGEAGQPFLIVHNELLPHYPIIATPDDREQGRTASLGNMIHYMDKLVGQLLTAVEEMGIRENTYVFFMGDNGTLASDFKNPKAGEALELAHTRHTVAGRVNGGKHELNDAGTHVPLIVWGPETVPPGTVCDDLIDVVDLFPTFCELSGTEIPEAIGLDGRSIVPQVHGKPGIQREWVHQEVGNDGQSVFDGKWRLFGKGDVLWDARKLPEEKPVSPAAPDAESERKKLQGILKAVDKGGTRPPLPFTKPSPN